MKKKFWLKIQKGRNEATVNKEETDSNRVGRAGELGECLLFKATVEVI